MNSVFVKSDIDFKGNHLCANCWNGHHFVTAPISKREINNCLHGNCDCPCQNMIQDKANQAHFKKQTKIANRKAQLELPIELPRG